MHPEASKYASTTSAAENAVRGFGISTDGPVVAIPLCACADMSTQTFTKYYNAGTNNPTCANHPNIPNKLGIATHTKTVCDNGGYWYCSYDEGGCTSHTESKPSCPSDTCRYF